MSSWCAWPHMRIATSSISVGPSPARARSAAHAKAAAIASGSVPSMRDARNAVAGAPCRRRRAPPTDPPTGVDSAVWLFSTQKIAGSRRAAQRLIASCHSPSDDPPSPMNETATRPEPSRAERHRHAGDRQRRDRQRRRRRQDAPVEIADVQILAVDRRAGLAHLRIQHHPDGRRLGTHRERRRRGRESPARRRRRSIGRRDLRYAAPRRSRMAAA